MRTDLRALDFEILGESHSPEMRLIIHNLPSGIYIDQNCVDEFIQKRSRKYIGSTTRTEPDEYKIISGIKDSYTTGEKIEIVAYNTNINTANYDTNLIRPSHADYVAYMRDGEISSGGGRFSGRLTLMFCILGGIAASILNKHGIYSYSFVSSIGKIFAVDVKSTTPSHDDVKINIEENYPFYKITPQQKQAIDNAISAVNGNDSLGGIVQSVVYVPENMNFGDALFEGLESKLAYYITSIPAVKGVEFGDGFDITKSLGSEMNDTLKIENGKIKIQTNHSGGIQGGIPNGLPIIISTAIKPTPSISAVQDTVDIANMKSTKISIKGRHDACIAMRVPICIDSAIYVALLDEYIKRSKDINVLRSRIDHIDQQVMQLLDQRINICKEIGKQKKINQQAITDYSREEQVLSKADKYDNPGGIKHIYSEIFKETKKVQK